MKERFLTHPQRLDPSSGKMFAPFCFSTQEWQLVIMDFGVTDDLTILFWLLLFEQADEELLLVD
jgi:hypothetical protein